MADKQFPNYFAEDTELEQLLRKYRQEDPLEDNRDDRRDMTTENATRVMSEIDRLVAEEISHGTDSISFGAKTDVETFAFNEAEELDVLLREFGFESSFAKPENESKEFTLEPADSPYLTTSKTSAPPALSFTKEPQSPQKSDHARLSDSFLEELLRDAGVSFDSKLLHTEPEPNLTEQLLSPTPIATQDDSPMVEAVFEVTVEPVVEAVPEAAVEPEVEEGIELLQEVPTDITAKPQPLEAPPAKLPRSNQPVENSFTAYIDAKQIRQQAIETPQEKDKRQPTTVALKPEKQSRRFVGFGIVMTLLALFGIIWLSVLGIGMVQSTMNQASAKKEWNHTVSPFVAIDVTEFDMNGSPLSDNAIISAAIWEFFLTESNLGQYQKDEAGLLSVPALKIEGYVRKLFGPNISFLHGSIQDGNMTISYDAINDDGKGVYYIPSTFPTVSYKPNVTAIDTKSVPDVTMLTVAYMVPMPMLSDEELFKRSTVAKTMRYYYMKTAEKTNVLYKVEAVTEAFPNN